MTVETVSVQMDARRVCDAIARIGYSPSSALMDITDNSVAADASSVAIEIELDPDKNFGDRSNVLSYRIVDNGKGMSNDQILNALKLGSDADYEPGSLSKYGMGLKAAGFSLGQRIEVLSKQQGVFSELHYVDRNEMQEEYTVSIEKLPEEQMAELAHCLPGESGTIVKIKGCDAITQQSAASTMRKLQNELGVVYHDFLGSEDALSIMLRCTGKDEVTVEPFDMLFRSIATEGFDPDTYDCRTPCLVLKKRLALLPDEESNPLIEAVVFPKDDLKSYAGFTDEERKQIKSFGVSRKNKGFFIYRNGRMIRWGDDLEGLVGRDDILFRARLSITTEHDDELHVDVSKQRLSIPDDVRAKIEVLIRNALSTASQVKELCNALPEVPEGEPFNERNETLPIEDPDEPSTEAEKEEKRKRRKKLQDRTESQIEEEQDDDSSEGSGEDNTPTGSLPPFRKVRYSEKVRSVDLYSSEEDPTDGVFVRINRNHSFHPTVLSQLPEDSAMRQSLEAMIWCLAAAENRTVTNLTEIDAETIEQVLRKFRSIASTTLDAWCARNQDLFADD